MKSWKTPTPEQVEKAIALIGHAEQYRYFFDRLENPQWIEPLKKRRFFSTPPSVNRDEAKGTVGFPPWPESRYLARMAAHAPKAVLDIILRIPDTENVRIHEDFVDAALAMPADTAARLVPKAEKWIESPYHLLLPEKLGALVSHLSKEGQGKEAFKLAQGLLAVLPDSRSVDPADEERIYRLPLEPRARFNIWNYERILKNNVPDLVARVGQDAFTLLCDLLDATIRLSQNRTEDEEPEDYSYIWRPAIEEHGQNRDRHGLRNSLITVVRNTAEQITSANPSQMQALVEKLEQRPWRIFHRIALHLLRVRPEKVPQLIAERLTNETLFKELSLWHEYILLARDHFAHLSSDNQMKILGWIASGPDSKLFEERKKQYDGKQPTPEEVERYAKSWRLRRLALLRDALPSEWKQRYDEWVAELVLCQGEVEG